MTPSRTSVGRAVLHATSGYAEAVRFSEQGLDWTISTMGDSDEFRMVTYGEGPTAVAGIDEGAAFSSVVLA